MSRRRGENERKRARSYPALHADSFLRCLGGLAEMRRRGLVAPGARCRPVAGGSRPVPYLNIDVFRARLREASLVSSCPLTSSPRSSPRRKSQSADGVEGVVTFAP